MASLFKEFVLRVLVSGHEPVLEPGDVGEAVAMGFAKRLVQEIPALTEIRVPIDSRYRRKGSRGKLGVAVLPDLHVHRIESDVFEPSQGALGLCRRLQGIVGGGRKPHAAQFGLRWGERHREKGGKSPEHQG